MGSAIRASLSATSRSAQAETITASFKVTNTGSRPGADVPQLNLTGAGGEQRLRLLGFERVELQPGESRLMTIAADPRLLARFSGLDGILGSWSIADGIHRVALGRSANDSVLVVDMPMKGRRFGS